MFLDPHHPLLHYGVICPSGPLRENTSAVSVPKQESSWQKAFSFKDIDRKGGFSEV